MSKPHTNISQTNQNDQQSNGPDPACTHQSLNGVNEGGSELNNRPAADLSNLNRQRVRDTPVDGVEVSLIDTADSVGMTCRMTVTLQSRDETATTNRSQQRSSLSTQFRQLAGDRVSTLYQQYHAFVLDENPSLRSNSPTDDALPLVSRIPGELPRVVEMGAVAATPALQRANPTHYTDDDEEYEDDRPTRHAQYYVSVRPISFVIPPLFTRVMPSLVPREIDYYRSAVFRLLHSDGAKSHGFLYDDFVYSTYHGKANRRVTIVDSSLRHTIELRFRQIRPLDVARAWCSSLRLHGLPLGTCDSGDTVCYLYYSSDGELRASLGFTTLWVTHHSIFVGACLVYPGCSGAPVVSLTTRLVVGIITQKIGANYLGFVPVPIGLPAYS